jgi:hypothetical protein
MSVFEKASNNLAHAVIAKPKGPLAMAMHHRKMAKYHAKEMEHHASRLEYLKKAKASNSHRPEWSKDYNDPIAKHIAFYKYHEKMHAHHSKK